MVQQFLLYRWLLSMAAVNGAADSAVPLWVGRSFVAGCWLLTADS